RQGRRKQARPAPPGVRSYPVRAGVIAGRRADTASACHGGHPPGRGGAVPGKMRLASPLPERMSMFRVPGVQAHVAGRLLAVLLLVLSFLLPTLLAGGQASASPVRVDAVEAELVADRTAVVPGESLRLGLRLAH